MALLKSTDGRLSTVPQHAIVGRGPACAMRLVHRSISNTHAALRWIDGQWEIRDLHSRNGTRLDGRRIEPGVRHPLQSGAVLEFGNAARSWQLIDAGAPAIRAVGSDGEVVVGTADLLLLPHADSPVQVYADGGGWMLDAGPVQSVVENGARVNVGDRVWQLCMPVTLLQTEEVHAPTLALRDIQLRFAVTPDEEHVEIDVVSKGAAIASLPHRAFSYMLLVLARARRAGDGWLYQDELVDMLRIEPARLYVQIFRARQQFGELGIRRAGRLVERRRGTGQVRLGVADLQLRTF
jgi:hypothetical protein